MTVENMITAKGNRIPNQFILRDEKQNLVIFQSYKSVIAEIFTKDAMGFKKNRASLSRLGLFKYDS